MSLATPSKIRELQSKLYRKAKNEPGYRFYMLYDKIYREDMLSHAYELARANKGASGVDGQSFADIESRGLREWLTGIRQELRNRTYQPQPVRRVIIPKPGGGERPLGIPTIRDRVVQTAAKLVLEPIFEADLEPSAYGYRPKRSAQDAIRKVHKLVCEGYTDVVDADLSRYFDTIPHCELMQCVAQRIVDRDVLRLIKMWLMAPVEERDENGKRRLTGGKDRHCGTPQGGVASPMLANLYMNRLLKGWRNTKRGEQFQAHVVNYADDFVILSRGKAALSGLHVRAAPLQEGWPLVFGSESVEEGGDTHQGKGGRPSEARQHGDLAGGAGSAESGSERLVGILQLRHSDAGVSGGRSLRCGLRAAFPAEASQGVVARHHAVF